MEDDTTVVVQEQIIEASLGAVDAAPSEAIAEEVPLPTVTPAAEWRRRANARWLVTLSSGVTVKAKRPDLTALILDGTISADAALELSSTTAVAGIEQSRRIIAIVEGVLPYLVVEPRVVPSGFDDASAVTVDQFTATEKLELWAWANGAAEIAAREIVEG